MTKLTYARLLECLDYSPLTGEFTRKVRTAQRHAVGDRADMLIERGPMAGYRRVSLDSERHLAHRLAWFYVHGEWPRGMLDHCDGDRSANRIDNLREASPKVNVENMRGPRRDNTSGFLGVYWHKQNRQWCARIGINRKLRHLGLYATPEEAHAAYLKAKRELHEGCTI